MSLISPTQYRSNLSFEQREMYRQIVSEIQKGKHELIVTYSSNTCPSIDRVLSAIHYDHPEIFWINWWSGTTCVHYPFRHALKISFQKLIDEKTVAACSKALQSKLELLKIQFPQASTITAKYNYVIDVCVEGISYEDTGSALWDHTVIGPLLTHTAVCEGFSKLFLLYCQYLSLPCMLIAGKVNKENHAWNMVVLDEQLKHVDITAEIQRKRTWGQLHHPVFFNTAQQAKLGYSWDTSICR